MTLHDNCNLSTLKTILSIQWFFKQRNGSFHKSKFWLWNPVNKAVNLKTLFQYNFRLYYLLNQFISNVPRMSMSTYTVVFIENASFLGTNSRLIKHKYRLSETCYCNNMVNQIIQFKYFWYTLYFFQNLNERVLRFKTFEGKSKTILGFEGYFLDYTLFWSLSPNNTP